MKIAVIGSGGREHAILWRLAKDFENHELYAVPGNGGTFALAKSVPVDTSDLEMLLVTLMSLMPDLVVVGPEAPLAAGLADRLTTLGIPCFGPCAAAARVEASKVFSKQLMQAEGIPTADFEIFNDFERLVRFVKLHPDPDRWVVKADGLAAGKGAFVCSSADEVLSVAHDLLVLDKLGEAGRTLVLERKLAGREVSALFLCDGERFAALPPAQDYKRAEDDDRGPNTGGMGSYCPASHFTAELQKEVGETVIAPVLRAMTAAGSPYRGVLYAGLMLTADGPKVIEFNCRFGDPETQVILPVLQGNFSQMLLACAEGRLSPTLAGTVQAHGAAVCVVMAAEGYPDTYRKAIPLKTVPNNEHSLTLHAGTAKIDGRLVSSGGRVLNAVGMGPTLPIARDHAYELASRLLVDGLRHRNDIARQV